MQREPSETKQRRRTAPLVPATIATGCRCPAISALVPGRGSWRSVSGPSTQVSATLPPTPEDVPGSWLPASQTHSRPGLEGEEPGPIGLAEPPRAVAIVETVAERHDEARRRSGDDGRELRQRRGRVVGRQHGAAPREGRALLEVEVRDQQNRSPSWKRAPEASARRSVPARVTWVCMRAISPGLASAGVFRLAAIIVREGFLDQRVRGLGRDRILGLAPDGLAADPQHDRDRER